jgi:hypothetical protein
MCGVGRLPNVEGVRPTRFSAHRPNIKGRDPVGCPGPGCTLYALASTPALSAEVRRVFLRLLARLGVDHELAKRYPAICAGVGSSSWWSWPARWGCCILMVSTVFPLFCGPGPGVCYHPRGHSFSSTIRKLAVALSVVPVELVEGGD